MDHGTVPANYLVSGRHDMADSFETPSYGAGSNMLPLARDGNAPWRQELLSADGEGVKICAVHRAPGSPPFPPSFLAAQKKPGT